MKKRVFIPGSLSLYFLNPEDGTAPIPAAYRGLDLENGLEIEVDESHVVLMTDNGVVTEFYAGQCFIPDAEAQTEPLDCFVLKSALAGATETV